MPELWPLHSCGEVGRRRRGPCVQGWVLPGRPQPQGRIITWWCRITFVMFNSLVIAARCGARVSPVFGEQVVSSPVFCAVNLVGVAPLLVSEGKQRVSSNLDWSGMFVLNIAHIYKLNNCEWRTSCVTLICCLIGGIWLYWCKRYSQVLVNISDIDRSTVTMWTSY